MESEIGFIEKAGTGIRRMREEAKKYGSPEPKFETTGFFTATFYPNPEVRRQALATTGEVTGQVTGQVAGQVLRFCQTPRRASEIQKLIGLRHRESFQNNYLKPLLETEWLERTIPDKPRSRMQGYRTTALGREVLRKRKGER